MTTDVHEDERIVDGYLVKMHGKALGIALGIMFGLGLFLVTNILVIKGGDDMGSHLGLLCNYFPGYAVEFFPGSFIGSCYAFVVGYLTGRVLCGVYNLAARSRG